MDGFSITAASKAVEGVVQIVVLMLLARLLTPEDFGVLSAVLVVTGVATTSYQLGVGPALIQRPTLTPEHVVAGFWFTQVLAAGMFCLVFVLANAVETVFRIDHLATYVRVAATLFVIEGAGAVSIAMLSRELRFAYLASMKITSYTIGYGIVGVVSAIAGAGAWSLVLAHLSQGVLHSLMAISGRRVRLQAGFSLTAWKELMVFGGGFTLGKLANHAATQGDNFIAGRYLGVDALGLYSRAYQLLIMPATLFGRVTDRVLFPVLSTIQGDHARVLSAYNRAIAGISTITMPLSAVCVLNANEIVLVIFGQDWLGAVVPFQLLAVGTLCRTSYKISDSVARALGLVYRRALRQAGYGVLVLVGTYLGAQYYGLPGVAGGVLTAVSLHYLLMNQLCYSRLRGRWTAFLSAHLPGLLLTLATIAVVLPTVTLGRHLDVAPIIILVASCAGSIAICTAIVATLGPYTIGRFEWDGAQRALQKLRRMAVRSAARAVE